MQTFMLFTHTMTMKTLTEDKTISALRLFVAALAAALVLSGWFLNFGEDIKMTASAEAPVFRLIAKFSTYYGDSGANRKHNVALSCSKIDGLVLYPEEEFSFNDQVGRRTIENGFRSAYIIKDGEFVEGVGGGVCQVSSTIYNAALLANLAITRVHAHSLPVMYVAPSFDAMVSSASDLRFVNTLSAPVTIKMRADGKYIRAEIYGVDFCNIQRRSQTLSTIPRPVEYIEDETLLPGEEKIDTYGKDGLTSAGYLDYYENGKVVKSVLIRKDSYKPQKRVVLRGKQPESDSVKESSPDTAR